MPTHKPISPTSFTRREDLTPGEAANIKRRLRKTTIYNMYYRQGLGAVEIAAVAGISRQRVWQILKYVRDRLEQPDNNRRMRGARNRKVA